MAKLVFGVCVLTVMVAVITTLAPPPLGLWGSSGGGRECLGDVCICPRETVCATSWTEATFLLFSRCSAYFDYPLYVLLFLTKAHNLRAFLHRSYLSQFVSFDEPHNLHALAGKIVAIEVWWHSFWHMLRWGLSGKLHLLWTHVTGQTGLAALILTPFITFPMMLPFLRKSLSFEFRKRLHYLAVPWAIAICFHAPAGHVAKIIGLALAIYAADWLYGFWLNVHYLETLHMTRFGNCVEVMWENPPGFDSKASGFVYLCLPWLNKVEWHAFSLIPHPELPSCSSVCVSALGDWTSQLNHTLKRHSCRPGYIYGPFPAAFNSASGFDRIVAVASGIGVTPCLSTISKHKGSSRQVNLIWLCNDPDLVEFYLNTFDFGADAWTLIYYDGERRLFLGNQAVQRMRRNPKVKIFKGRCQDLEGAIFSIVDAINSRSELSPSMMEAASKMMQHLDVDDERSRFMLAIDMLAGQYSAQELFEMAAAESRHLSGSDDSIRGQLDVFRARVSLEGFCRMMQNFLFDDDRFTKARRTGSKAESGPAQDQTTPYSPTDLVEKIKRFSQIDLRTEMSKFESQEIDASALVDQDISELTDSIGTLAEDGFYRFFLHLQELGRIEDNGSRSFLSPGHDSPVQRRHYSPVAALQQSSSPILGWGSPKRGAGSPKRVHPLPVPIHQVAPIRRHSIENAADSFLSVKATPSHLQQSVSDGWTMLYCGGSPGLVKLLRQISAKTGIPLGVESFIW